MSGAIATQIATKVGKQVLEEAVEEGIKQGIKQGVKEGVKQGAIQIGESSLKGIPFVGLALNGVLGIREIARGNVFDGIIDISQGVVGCIPGVGWGFAIVTALGGVALKQVNKHLNRR